MSAPRMTRRHLTGLVGLLALSACADGGDGLPARLERIKPTDIPTPGLTARPEPPLQTRQVQGPRFTLSIPASWTDRELTAPEGSRIFAYDATGRPPERPVRVGVVVEDPAASDSIEQAQVLVVSKTVAGAEEIRSSLLTWPGAVRAVLVDWIESPGGTGAPYRTRQLMVQAASSAIVNILAVAPADEFDELGLDDIVATLRLRSS